MGGWFNSLPEPVIDSESETNDTSPTPDLRHFLTPNERASGEPVPIAKAEDVITPPKDDILYQLHRLNDKIDNQARVITGLTSEVHATTGAVNATARQMQWIVDTLTGFFNNMQQNGFMSKLMGRFTKDLEEAPPNG